LATVAMSPGASVIVGACLPPRAAAESPGVFAPALPAAVAADAEPEFESQAAAPNSRHAATNRLISV